MSKRKMNRRQSTVKINGVKQSVIRQRVHGGVKVVIVRVTK